MDEYPCIKIFKHDKSKIVLFIGSADGYALCDNEDNLAFSDGGYAKHDRRGDWIEELFNLTEDISSEIAKSILALRNKYKKDIHLPLNIELQIQKYKNTFNKAK